MESRVVRTMRNLSRARLLWIWFSLFALVGLLLPWWELTVRYSFGGGAPQEDTTAFLWGVFGRYSQRGVLNPFGHNFSSFVATVTLGPTTTLSIVFLILSSLTPLVGIFLDGRRERTFLHLQALWVTATFASYVLGLAFNLANMRIPVAYGRMDYQVGVSLLSYAALRVTGGALIFRTWLTYGFWYTVAVLFIPLVTYIKFSKTD